ncbi:hypothetical protein [Paenibacillus sp. MBLB4367]|uniref:hypothetical protein n=1 Tax=Paenibacillus sp. MBLB4367 TaxID=3384767 RepID=UPI0039083DAA
MKQTRLLLIEGLPSTGKSTNSGIVFRQLERNGFHARWIHEVVRPHPTLFFNEAWLEPDEYSDYVSRYPDAATVTDPLIVKHGSAFGLDLLEIEWKG